MNLLKNNLVFLIPVIFIIVVIVVVTQLNQGNIEALGIVVITTSLTALGSVATYVQALETKRQRENAENPEISVYFQALNGLMYCVIQNLGNNSARNVEIIFSPSPMSHDGQPLDQISLFAKPITYLPPNEKYKRHLGASPTFFTQNTSPITISLNYFSVDGRNIKDKYIIDMSVFKEANFPENSASYQLGKITEKLDKLIKILDK